MRLIAILALLIVAIMPPASQPSRQYMPLVYVQEPPPATNTPTPLPTLHPGPTIIIAPEVIRMRVGEMATVTITVVQREPVRLKLIYGLFDYHAIQVMGASSAVWCSSSPSGVWCDLPALPEPVVMVVSLIALAPVEDVVALVLRDDYGEERGSARQSVVVE